MHALLLVMSVSVSSSSLSLSPFASFYVLFFVWFLSLQVHTLADESKYEDHHQAIHHIDVNTLLVLCFTAHADVTNRDIHASHYSKKRHLFK